MRGVERWTTKSVLVKGTRPKGLGMRRRGRGGMYVSVGLRRGLVVG